MDDLGVNRFELCGGFGGVDERYEVGFRWIRDITTRVRRGLFGEGCGFRENIARSSHSYQLPSLLVKDVGLERTLREALILIKPLWV